MVPGLNSILWSRTRIPQYFPPEHIVESDTTAGRSELKRFTDSRVDPQNEKGKRVSWRGWNVSVPHSKRSVADLQLLRSFFLFILLVVVVVTIIIVRIPPWRTRAVEDEPLRTGTAANRGKFKSNTVDELPEILQKESRTSADAENPKSETQTPQQSDCGGWGGRDGVSQMSLWSRTQEGGWQQGKVRTSRSSSSQSVLTASLLPSSSPLSLSLSPFLSSGGCCVADNVQHNHYI